MPAARSILSPAALVLLTTGTLSAQAIASAPAPVAVATPFVVTPMPVRLTPPIASVATVAEVNHAAPQPTVARAARRQSSTLMLVGGAAVVTGILLDEGVITFVGAGVGLYGLYLYLR